MSMVAWLKECDICNVGLCKRMDELTASVANGGRGLSEREAARVMEQEAEQSIGTKVWSARVIRDRYRYNTGKDKSGGISAKPKPMKNGLAITEPTDGRPLFQSNKEEFLRFIKTMHGVWCKAVGKKQSTNVEPACLRINTNEPSSKKPPIKIKLEQYEKLMKGERHSVDLEISMAFANFFFDLNLPLSFTVTVPEKVYVLAGTLKKHGKRNGTNS